MNGGGEFIYSVYIIQEYIYQVVAGALLALFIGGGSGAFTPEYARLG